VGKKENGYHLLDSLVCFPTIADVVTIESTSKLPYDMPFRCIIDGRFAEGLCMDESNLVHKAAKAYYDKMEQLQLDVPKTFIRLTKNLPIASGIGGGSADAAAVLRGLNKLFHSPFSPQELHALGLPLGADVPVCIAQTPCIMRGIGDVFKTAPTLPEFYMALVNPGIATPTPQVFRNRAPVYSDCVSWPTTFTNLSSFADFLQSHTSNDLFASASQIVPVLYDVMARLQETSPAFCGMSGSGATCFGIYDSAEAARTAITTIQRQHPQWWATYGLCHAPDQ
jgi:4-diphosphocytidyl-2-C-methyl-D-erythritol kinase